MSSFFFIIILFHVCSAQYSIDLSNPFLPTNSIINIVTVEIDQQNSYLVSFQDGQARRYSSDFATFTELSVPQIVQQFNSKTIEFSINLSDSKNFSMFSDMTTTLSNSLTTLRAYTYPQFFRIHSFTFTEPIINYQGLPLQFSGINPLHILVFNSTTKVIYDDIAATVFDVSQIFGNGSYNTAVAFKECLMIGNVDEAQFRFIYYHTVSALGLVQFNVTVAYKYSTASSEFRFVFSFNYHVLKQLSVEIHTIKIANQIVLMQYSSLIFLFFVEIATIVQREDPYIQKSQILDFFYFINTYYILYTNGLLELSIDAANCVLISTTLVSKLPTNSYQLAFGTNIDILLVPGTSNIYKAKCPNQTSYFEGTCISYSCTVANCKLCPFTENTCGTCAEGFAITDSFTCAGSTAKDSLMVANISLSNNPIDSTKSTRILTAQIQLENTTNLPINSTSPPVNITSLFILSSSNSSSNDSSNAGQVSAFQSLIHFLGRLGPLFQRMLNGTKNIMSVPALRRICPIFYFFANFDDLYLYCYHDRLYGNVMTGLFNELSDIEGKKWSLLGYGTLFNLFGLSNSSFFAQIDYQNAYVSYSFRTPNRPYMGSEGLLANCANFFLVAVALTLAGFIALRILFRLLFRFPVSRLLRKFDFWGCLLAALFDGNIQLFAFYSAAEWRSAFFFSLGDKCMKAFAIGFGFTLVAVSIGGFLIAFGMYGRLNKYLVDNNRNCLRGVGFLLLQSGLRNFIFGVLHSVLRPLPYTVTIAVLLSAELLFALLFVLSLTLGIYKRSSFMWFYVIISLLRILLIATLAADYQQIDYDVIENIQCTLLVIILVIYLLATLVVISVLFTEACTSLTKISKPKPVRQSTTGNQNKIKIEVDILEPQNHKYLQKRKNGIDQIKIRCRGQGVYILKDKIMRRVEVEKGVQKCEAKAGF